MQLIMVGAILWLALWVVPVDPNLGLGTIEKLFLLAPLVVVPVGWKLLGAPGGCALPVAAGLVVGSFFLPLGNLAGVMVLPWLVLALWGAVQGLRRWRWDPVKVCENTALLMLPVGAVGLMQSRAGMEPLGFREPLVMLVAVHFHYAAFVSPLMASRVVKNWPVTILVCAGSPVLAAGYVLDAGWLRLTGATMLVVGLLIVSVLIMQRLREIRPRAAQVLLGGAAVAVWYAMAYAAVYAVADFYGEVWVAIPQMARTHGVVNAVVFSAGGLLGWHLVKPNRKEQT